MARIWKTPRKILRATDMTPVCDQSLDRAVELAAHWKAKLLVVHVVDDTGLQTENFTERARKAEVALNRQIKCHPAASRLEADAFVVLGNPAERILSKCDRMFIDLLVMGPGERATLGQRLLGSTVDHVLRHALQPVLSVRNRAFTPYRRMAIATDFSGPSREALDCALTLFPDAKATVVHAYDDALRGLLASDRMTGPLAERHKLEMKASAEKSIGEFVESVRTSRPDVATAVEIATPDVGLKRYVEQCAPDLVVVGTHGRTGLRRAVIGSVAERLIGILPCDVLAVRPAE